jgi:AcrR family transcriptional regulator/predicted DNA-binding transcriptional regulator AlpA
MPEAPTDDELIDAAEVARILGLAHRNSVSTYRSRYPDFPRGRPAPGGGRTLLWPRSEITAWHEGFTARRRVDPDAPKPRLEKLVEATARLMLSQPGTEVSIRQIAAEAGAAHSDLYRYAASKDQLERAAVDRINAEFAASMPADYDTLVESLLPLLRAVQERQAAMRVLAHEMISSPGSVPRTEIAISAVADVVAAHRAQEGIESEVSPQVVAACVGAIAWGITLFGERWRKGLGVDELPQDEVVRVLRAVLSV